MNYNFTEIVHNTKGVVLSAIGANLPDRYSEYIDDIVQETYIRAYKALDKNQFRKESEISTYLYTIAKNETYRLISKLKREEEKYEKLKNEKKDNSVPDETVSILTELIELIKKIPLKYRQVMEMYIYGNSEKEISDKLSLKIGTVKSRTSRGKDYLKRVIGE